MSEAVLGPKSAKYRVFCGYTWKTPVYLENTWVSCRFPQFCPRFCPRPALRLRETREFPEGNSRETEWSTKHPVLVSLETSGNAKCWGPSCFPLGCRKPLYRPTRRVALFLLSLAFDVRKQSKADMAYRSRAHRHPAHPPPPARAPPRPGEKGSDSAGLKARVC